jgi:hypothetical protein
MEPSPKRRISRPIVWILAVVVLLPVAYIFFFLVASYENGAGRIPPTLEPLVGLGCLPGGLYIASELPGATALQDASEWAWRRGKASIAE